MPKPRRDDTLIMALVRAHRWRRRSESGHARSIIGLAGGKGVTDAHPCRMLPLICLAPDIVEAIPRWATAEAEKLANGALDWNEQRSVWGFDRDCAWFP